MTSKPPTRNAARNDLAVTAPPAQTLLARSVLADAVHDWCLRNATTAERHGRLHVSTAWIQIAADVAKLFGQHLLCSGELEELLTRVGRATCPTSRKGNFALRRRWLHVFSQTYPIGGHTAIARRWIGEVRGAERHSVALTDQRLEAADPGLLDAVRRNGGTVHSLADAATPVERARRLRALADEVADIVVLHIHQSDIVAPLAFAAPGGAPVILMNHQDHAFWIGAHASDQVVDIRDSGAQLTRRHRGPKSHAMLPIPLVDRGLVRRDRSPAARLAGSVLESAEFVLLTVGSPHKYQPSQRFDFPAAVGRIAKIRPRCVILAVGPRAEDPVWSHLRADSNGRVIALGLQRDLAPWHAAADVYVEGFPIGSYTALLEAALAGRPIVRKPLLAPPRVLPIDRGALADIDPPGDADEWVTRVLELTDRPDRWADRGLRRREAVLAIHCADAWRRHVEAFTARLPTRHEPGPGSEVEPVDPELRRYWASTSAGHYPANPFGWAFGTALHAGLRPRADLAVARALRLAREQILDTTSPALALTASWALSMMPQHLALRIYSLPT